MATKSKTVVEATETVAVVEAVAAPVVSKASLALAIYNEEVAVGTEKLRARVIKRFQDELGMGSAGASTYFQNTKKIASGGKVKHYYKSKSEAPVDNSSDSVPDSFDVKLLDGTIQTFLSQQDADNFIESNPSIVDPDQSVEAELEA